tara:strand:- start:630 stop:875 length:246 start_codon:yes stop_codon:yes gene_type:complete
MAHFMTMVWNEDEQHHVLLLTVAKDKQDAEKRLKEQGFKPAEDFNFLRFDEIAGKDLVIETHDLQSQHMKFEKMASPEEQN